MKYLQFTNILYCSYMGQTRILYPKNPQLETYPEELSSTWKFIGSQVYIILYIHEPQGRAYLKILKVAEKSHSYVERTESWLLWQHSFFSQVSLHSSRLEDLKVPLPSTFYFCIQQQTAFSALFLVPEKYGHMQSTTGFSARALMWETASRLIYIVLKNGYQFKCRPVCV